MKELTVRLVMFPGIYFLFVTPFSFCTMCIENQYVIHAYIHVNIYTYIYVIIFIIRPIRKIARCSG